MVYPKRPLELYTHAAEEALTVAQWQEILSTEDCRYLGRRCDKIRKSRPDLTIGTCAVGYRGNPVIICPHRFLQRQQIFIDTLHLLTQHKPGNQLHVVPEISVPGGSIDFFVASVNRGEIEDYLALEIQSLDTTGSVWPARQRFIREQLGLDAQSEKDTGYGMNWKMTAKTILIQMHHKAETLELLNRKLVLVMQDVFFAYIAQEFSTSALRNAEEGDSVQLHAYALNQENAGDLSLQLAARYSTNSIGIETMLGLRQDPHIPEEQLLAALRARLSDKTLLTLYPPP